MKRSTKQLTNDLSLSVKNYFPATQDKKEGFEVIATELESIAETQEEGLEKTITTTIMLQAREAALCIELANSEQLSGDRLHQIMKEINRYLSVYDSDNAQALYSKYNTIFNSGTSTQVKQPLQTILKSIIAHLEYRIGRMKRYLD